MSLDVGESEKCYQFLDGGVHCWQVPTAAFRDRQHSARSDWSAYMSKTESLWGKQAISKILRG